MAPWLLCCFARSPPATAWRTLQQMTLPRAYANCCYACAGYLNIGGNLQFATKTRENTSISRGTMADGLLAGRCLLNVRMKMDAPTNCLAKSMRSPIPRHSVSVTPCPQDDLKWKNKETPMAPWVALLLRKVAPGYSMENVPTDDPAKSMSKPLPYYHGVAWVGNKVTPCRQH